MPFPPVSFSSSDAVVHIEYPIGSPPPVKSNEWTRFVCISDTHGRTFEVPDGDVLLHSGDLTNTGTLVDFQRTMDWLCSLPHKTKMCGTGNHDLTLQKKWYDDNYKRWHRRKENVSRIMDLVKGKKAKKAGVVYLEDGRHEFKAKEGGRSWSVYGSPWSPEFFSWAFNYSDSEAERIVGKFPKTDILMTHGPPYNIFDRTNGEAFPGCRVLTQKLPCLRPRIHLFGHIHEAHGAYIHHWASTPDACAPRIQVALEDDSEDEDEDEDESLEKRPFTVEYDNLDPYLDGRPELEELDCTVFVNAANWPSGPRSYADKFGGTGFMPVIVDLKD